MPVIDAVERAEGGGNSGGSAGDVPGATLLVSTVDTTGAH